jgi:hypothetical protein
MTLQKGLTILVESGRICPGENRDRQGDEQMAKHSEDTLKATFDKFFGPSEDTCGTGMATRDIDGTLQTVIVDQDEYNAWMAERAAQAAQQDAEIDELTWRDCWEQA